MWRAAERKTQVSGACKNHEGGRSEKRREAAYSQTNQILRQFLAREAAWSLTWEREASEGKTSREQLQSRPLTTPTSALPHPDGISQSICAAERTTWGRAEDPSRVKHLPQGGSLKSQGIDVDGRSHPLQGELKSKLGKPGQLLEAGAES